MYGAIYPQSNYFLVFYIISVGQWGNIILNGLASSNLHHPWLSWVFLNKHTKVYLQQNLHINLHVKTDSFPHKAESQNGQEGKPKWKRHLEYEFKIIRMSCSNENKAYTFQTCHNRHCHNIITNIQSSNASIESSNTFVVLISYRKITLIILFQKFSWYFSWF